MRGIHRSPVNSPHKGQWCGALMFSFICLNKRLSRQWRDWWFETPSHPSWRHCNEKMHHVNPNDLMIQPQQNKAKQNHVYFSWGIMSYHSTLYDTAHLEKMRQHQISISNKGLLRCRFNRSANWIILRSQASRDYRITTSVLLHYNKPVSSQIPQNLA